MSPRSILYLLPRTGDIVSMNSGKAMAHVGHAVSQFAEWVFTGPNEVNLQAAREWFKDSRGAGTKITLKTSGIQEIRNLVKSARFQHLQADIYLDPEYPLMDGETLHLIPLETCGWIFVPGDRVEEIREDLLGHLELHP